MTTSVPTSWGDLEGVWTTADPQSLPAASSALATGIAGLIDGYQGNFATVALLKASTPASGSWATSDNAPGARFQYVGSTWIMYGTPRVSALANITSPATGDLAVLSSTLVTYRYSGSAWVVYMSGQFVIHPSTAVNATIGSDGQLSVSAASSFSANGCFTSLYDTYALNVNLQLSANSEVTVRLRLAGSDISTANYNDVRVYTTTASTIQQSLAATAFRLSISPGGTSGWLQGEVRFIAPALTSATGYNSGVSAAVGNTAMAQSRVTGNHSLATAYDGFSVIATSGTMTGTTTILGCP